MISPSSFEVFALKFLQKSMILTPCGPSAVPTGGAGVALPAAIWSFTIACIFFAIAALYHRGHGGKTKRSSLASPKKNSLCPLCLYSVWIFTLCGSDLLHLQK